MASKPNDDPENIIIKPNAAKQDWANAPAALPPLSSSMPDDDSDAPQQLDKRKRILAACHDRDLESLKLLCTEEGGLLDDGLRRTACTLDRQLDRHLSSSPC